MDSLTIVRTERGKIQTRLREIETEIKQTRRHIEELGTLPLSPEDMTNLLCESLANQAKEIPALLKANVDSLLHRPLTKPDSALSKGISLLSAGRPPSLAKLDVAMYAMFPQQVKQFLHAQFEAMGYEHGLPRAERQIEIQRLQTKIVELETERKKITVGLESIKKEVLATA